MKQERGLLGVEDLVDQRDDKGKLQRGLLRRAGVPRTAAAIGDHIRNGWLNPVNWRPKAGRPQPDPDLRFDSPQLFTRAAVDKYIEWLHREDEDGRLGRPLHYDNDPRWRGQWYQARHGSSAEFGRVASVMAQANGAPSGPPSLGRQEPELAERVLELLAKQCHQREIVRIVNSEIASGHLKPRTLKRQKRGITRDHVRGVDATRANKVGDNPLPAVAAGG